MVLACYRYPLDASFLNSCQPFEKNEGGLVRWLRGEKRHTSLTTRVQASELTRKGENRLLKVPWPLLYVCSGLHCQHLSHTTHSSHMHSASLSQAIILITKKLKMTKMRRAFIRVSQDLLLHCSCLWICNCSTKDPCRLILNCSEIMIYFVKSLAELIIYACWSFKWSRGSMTSII